MSYSEFHGITVDSIQDELDCSEIIAKKILAISEVGYQNGLDGIYLGEDYSNDSDWVNSIGSKIEFLSEESGIDEDDILSYYSSAIGSGYADSEDPEVLIDNDDLDDF